MRFLQTVAMVLLMGACSGGDTRDPDPSNVTPDAGMTETDAGVAEQDAGTISAPTFDEIFTEILTPAGCTNGYCHGSGAGYLLLTDVDSSYQNLVGADAFNGSCGVDLRVTAGDPDASLLWKKIAPSVSVCGDKMPMGTTGLSAQDAERIRLWIEDGAPR